jgi:hypothetical protein
MIDAIFSIRFNENQTGCFVPLAFLYVFIFRRMMNMNLNPLIYLIIIIFLLSACYQKEDARKIINEVSFERMEDIVFPIDNQTFFAPLVHGYSETIQKLYIWNDYNSSIYLFDMEKQKSAGRIPLELGPSTGLNEVNYVHFHSEDSIFLFDERSRRLVLHIPSKSYYLSQQVVQMESNDPTTAMGRNPSHFYLDNYLNAYMLTKPLPDRTSLDKSSTLLRYSFTSGERKFIFPYPDDYLADQAKLYAESSFTFAPDLKKILLSLAFTHEIIVLDTFGNLVDLVPSESSRMTPYKGGKNYLKPPTGEWELSESRWMDIVYDSFNDLFYHVGNVSYYYRDIAGNREKGKSINNDSSYQIFSVRCRIQ